MRFLSVIAILSFLIISVNGQQILTFPLNINEMIRNGSVVVTHDAFDIGSINDVFDGNDQSLARSAAINPLTITLSFPFKVTFFGARILQTYGDGWWTMEAADTETDLANKTGSYFEFVSMSSLIDGVADEFISLPLSKKIIRLTVMRTTGDDYVHLNEWQLIDASAEVEIYELCFRPSQLWLLPGTNFNVAVYGMDESGNSYPMQSGVSLIQEDPALISINVFQDERINVSSISGTGSTHVTAEWMGITTDLPVNIAEEFKMKIAEERIVKVALVIIDPPIEAVGGLRFHERFGWDDPFDLSNALVDSLNSAGGGAVNYKIVSISDEDSLYAALQGTYVTVDSMYQLFLEPGWTTFHQLEQIGGFAFDYNGLLNALDLCTQSNNKVIDEVWVYSMPFTGMYESRLTGNGAFWYNSPPLSGNTCVDQLPIMGFNYERGVAEAMHSFGHRVESAMVHTFGRWDYNAVDKNDWELFASYDEAVPGNAHIGNIHFPPNGVSDYDYGNPQTVITFVDNWSRYPFLFNDQREVTCAEWNCSHLDYMSWWYHHLPHFTCKNRQGILNNWWPYIVDYNEGKLLEKETSDCNCEYVETSTAVEEIKNEFSFKIYPNPSQGFSILELNTPFNEKLKASLTNKSGILLAQFEIPGDTKSTSLELKNIPPGSYNMRIENKKGRILHIEQLIIFR